MSVAMLLQINNEIMKQFSIRHTRHSFLLFDNERYLDGY